MNTKTDTSHEIYQTGIRLWAEWTAMWNGRTELALALVAPRFALHLSLPSPTDPASVHDPESVKQWVDQHRAKFERITFHYEVGPYVDTVAGVVAGPWSAEIVAGGKTSRVCGMDTLAFRDGKICEYWTLAKESETVTDWTREMAR